jgi:hypothetical protein
MPRHSTRTLLVAALIFFAVVGRLVPDGLAQDVTPKMPGPVLPPQATVAGLSLGEWNARSWQWALSFPADVNPYFDDTGERCGHGQTGPVFFLVAADSNKERDCTVPAGRYLFVPLLGSGCSTVEPPPFFGRDEAELTQCADAAVDFAERALDMDAMLLTIDGQSLDRDELAAYRAVTPLFTLWLPEENFLNTDRPVADSVAAGYQVMLRPLPPGEHELVMVIPGPLAGERVTILYHLTVVSGESSEVSGTPVASPVPA